jgi:hypothetical protein
VRPTKEQIVEWLRCGADHCNHENGASAALTVADDAVFGGNCEAFEFACGVAERALYREGLSVSICGYHNKQAYCLEAAQLIEESLDG